MRQRRKLAFAALALAVGLSAVGTAEAGTLGVGDDVYSFFGSPGEQNLTSVVLDGSGRFVFRDNGGQNVAVTGPNAGACTGANTPVVSCPLPSGDAAFFVLLGDGNDVLVVGSGFPMTFLAQGEEGNDVVEGGPRGDRLTGGDGNDTLEAKAGDDSVIGAAGMDTQNGGEGTDQVVYDDGRAAGVTVDLTAGTGGDGELLTGFESVMGTPHPDSLKGTTGDDRLDGLGGIDTIDDGGGGTDILSYRSSAVGVTVNVVTNGNSENDVLFGRWESVVGSTYADTLIAQSADFAVEFEGHAGADVLVGGTLADRLEGGNDVDTLIGGAGADFLYGGDEDGVPDTSPDVVRYDDGRTTPVVTELAGTRQDGDVYFDVQNVVGGPAGDTLTGDTGANLIFGLGGNDLITGGAGSDDLQAGEGDDEVRSRDGEVDTVNCGPGIDLPDVDAGDLLTECEAVPVVAPPPPATPPAARRCVVPNVKNRTVARARRLLNARRCRLGKVRRAYSRRIRKGRVISQARRSGARLPQRAKVAVVVSRGRRR